MTFDRVPLTQLRGAITLHYKYVHIIQVAKALHFIGLFKQACFQITLKNLNTAAIPNMMW